MRASALKIRVSPEWGDVAVEDVQAATFDAASGPGDRVAMRSHVFGHVQFDVFQPSFSGSVAIREWVRCKSAR